MTLSNLLLGIWFILVGITWLTWVAIDTRFLGLWAFVTGIVLLVESVHPVTLWKRQ